MHKLCKLNHKLSTYTSYIYLGGRRNNLQTMYRYKFHISIIIAKTPKLENHTYSWIYRPKTDFERSESFLATIFLPHV